MNVINNNNSPLVIPIFTSNGKAAGSLQIYRKKHPTTDNFIWTTKLDVGQLRDSSGLYEWIIYSKESPNEELARYIGVAKNLSNRIPMYFRDMASQLVDLHGGQVPILKSGKERKEKAKLRWIHFWLAWAYSTSSRIELVLHPTPSRDVDAEKKLIEEACKNLRPLVNRENLPSGQVYVHKVLAAIVDPSPIASINAIIPPNWIWPYKDCQIAFSWLEAIRKWQQIALPPLIAKTAKSHQQ